MKPSIPPRALFLLHCSLLHLVLAHTDKNHSEKTPVLMRQTVENSLSGNRLLSNEPFYIRSQTQRKYLFLFTTQHPEARRAQSTYIDKELPQTQEPEAANMKNGVLYQLLRLK